MKAGIVPGSHDSISLALSQHIKKSTVAENSFSFQFPKYKVITQSKCLIEKVQGNPNLVAKKWNIPFFDKRESDSQRQRLRWRNH